MKAHKIFNDPVYGFIAFQHKEIYELIEHPIVQRLRRISQLALTELVYPGAKHHRFGHALGALHLTTKAIQTLREKKVQITDDEALAVSIAILLHDIGHGPFSHSLEFQLIQVSHEVMGRAIVQHLDNEFGGKLQKAIQILEGTYEKKFLHQLVSSQLDMDRLDYLTRDSYYTGVAEGIIGYDRIIKMLNVKDNQLVVEEKGVYSIEKFLISRRIMYWQVYLHKTSIASENMMVLFVKYLRMNWKTEKNVYVSKALGHFLERGKDHEIKITDIKYFADLDDYDIWASLKSCRNAKNKDLAYLSTGILNRKLFKTILQKSSFDSDLVDTYRHKFVQIKDMTSSFFSSFPIQGKVSQLAYDPINDPILVLLKSSKIVKFHEISDAKVSSELIKKHYLCYPKKEQ